MSRQFACVSILGFGLCLSLLTACAPKFQESTVTNIPVSILNPSTSEVDLDIALEVARKKIREVLPDAYFGGIIFSGKCQALPRLQGKLVLIFARVRPALFKQQVVSGVVSIDTVKQMMDLDYTDHSDYEWYDSPKIFVGDRSFKEIAALAHTHITKLGLYDCDVTLTQMDDSWDVRCGPLENFIQECRFEVINGKIPEKRK
jgi:hypothetical protein